MILYKGRRDEETQFIVVWNADVTTKCDGKQIYTIHNGKQNIPYVQNSQKNHPEFLLVICTKNCLKKLKYFHKKLLTFGRKCSII